MNPFKKIAAYCVTKYANKIYYQAKDMADSRHEDENEMIYVITNPKDNKTLMAINTKEFLDLRHRFNIPSKELTIQMLKNTCWYHTPSKLGKDALPFYELTIRRLAFVRELLKRAKLA